MRAPEFWHYASWQRTMLLPLSWAYRGAARLRNMLATPYRAEIAVLCVGNIVAGGAGKTPTVIAIATILQDMGRQPHIISRGYGGNAIEATRVMPAHTANDVGDEPLLLAGTAPCWVGKNRRALIEVAAQAGADCIIMDDGFQNPHIIKDTSIIVIDGGYGFGNGAVIPAGPCRETLKPALTRADAALVIGEDTTNIMPLLKNTTLLRGTVNPHINTALRDTPLIAFCGIGRPQKFYDMLRDCKLNVTHTQDFPDHYYYAENDLHLLHNMAIKQQATLVTTEKDWLRLNTQWRKKIYHIPITLSITPPDKLTKILQNLRN